MASEDNSGDGVTFDLKAVEDAISKCRQPDGTILMDKYMEAYDQLVQFFLVLGSVFKFVVSDIVSKLGILRQHREGANGQSYATVQSMIQYEVDKNLTRVKTNSLPSGSRTLLRLHRALLFIQRLFEDISSAGPEDDLSKIVWKAYDDTIAQYHTWIIRKTVGVAVYAVPNRKNMLKKFQKKAGEGAATEEELLEIMRRVVKDIQPIYDEVQRLYTVNNILDLP